MSSNAKRRRKNAKPSEAPLERSRLGWDDLEVVLALSRAGSLASAAARLGVNTSTVGRRLDAIEAALGIHLFDRSPSGMAPSELAEALLPIAEAMERSVADALRLIEGRETEPEGTVRLSAPPGVANWLVAPALVRLRERHPQLTIELDASIGYADLTRREADLALRGSRPRSGDLVSVRVTEAESVIVAAPELVAQVGKLERLDAIDWITWGPDLAGLPDARWITANVDARRVVLRTSSMDAQIQAARTGLGALLIARPFVGHIGLDEVPLSRGLTRRLPATPSGALWLVGHRALRDVPRIRAVWDFIVEQFRGFEC
ncbi:MAG: LysR family transcriptional regulator [Enhygromyxa sp.]